MPLAIVGNNFVIAWEERATMAFVLQVQRTCIDRSISPCLPMSPHISPYLPHISPYLHPRYIASIWTGIGVTIAFTLIASGVTRGQLGLIRAN